jgi:NAD-dependent DNA ligase
LEYKLPEERIDGRAINPSLKKVESNLPLAPLPPLPPLPPLKKVEPNLPLAPLPPLPPLKKVEPNLPLPPLETQLEEPIQLAPKAPKAPKIKKTKTLKVQPLNKVEPKTKTKKTLIIEEDSEDLAVKNEALAIDNFRKNGIKVLDAMTEQELTSMLNYANTMYRNFQPIMTDNEYDILEDYIKEKYPNNNAIQKIGAPVTKNKVTLPYFMGSMDKIKPDTNALTNWKTKYKGPYLLSCKLDGVSGLYTTEENTPKLYTRGDGKVGQDISYLIPYLRLPKNKGLVIRGEFIISKETFSKKYKEIFANARNMVSGIVNQKSINPDIIKDVDFVSYELIKPVLKPSDQFTTLQKLDIIVVQHTPPLEKETTSLTPPFQKETTSLTPPFQKVDNELLSKILIDWRQSSPYEIDGVIVTDDQIYSERKSGNPEHSFAFKMVLSDQIAEAKVVDVIWTPSKDGYLKPRVQIEPINLGGVKIEYATGFNGQFIEENKIGIGAVIELIRSGDVIPHIRKVTTPATEAKMPQVPYKWNNTHVDVLLEDIESDEIVKEKNITGFFRGIEVEGLSSGNISRIIAAGFNTIPKILQMTPQDFLQVEGFKEKTSQKLYTNIQTKIQEAPLVTIMAASNIFGRGFSDKKLELIINEYPDVILSNESQNIKTQKVANIKGMAEKTAEAFISKIPAFLAFVKEANLESKLQQQNNQKQKQSLDQSHPLYNKTIVFTGFRDKTLEEQLKAVGAKLGSSVSKNTFILLTKDPLDETGKVLEAKKLNITIMTPEEFINLFHF